MTRGRDGPPRHWPVRRPVAIGMVSVLILVAGFGGWAITARITGAVIAPGRIEVEQNRQVVQHIDGGVLREILVSEGDTVPEGRVLVRLDPDDLTAQLAIVEGQLFEVLARRARFEAERDGADTLAFAPILRAEGDAETRELMQGQQRLFRTRLETAEQEAEKLRRRAGQVRSQVDGIAAQQAALARQLDLIEEELESQRALLDRGLAQAGKVLALEREKARMSGQAGDLAARRAEAEEKITELDLEIIRLRTARREEAITRLRDLQFNELELREQRADLQRRLDRLEIRAPVSGVVHGLQVFGAGAVIRPAEPVLYLVPQDRPLVIAARVAPTDIDSVRLGQSVTLRFSSLDTRRTPEISGTVRQVSADAFTDEATGRSYYEARVVLNAGAAARLPEDTTLIPGMPVETFIRTVDRTPMAYLTQPLMDYLARTFRES
ncbi:HlyD family type I secretion periplasmic adaptor subunit [Salibaculum halophilum]|uniref:HlyD family type I secretion periplasmic adaptor subunit n=1 Tax=Salibaculum halophilum TaxID=1914408 RepID=UPI000A11A7E7|nr:HlyD family type I secretion periplasmic adaptor subunit [Salibaculum halophilum]